MPELSVLMPVYNENRTIREIVEKILALPLDLEIIIVNDGSSDGSEKILRELHMPRMHVIHHISNRGKGEAIATALSKASGTYSIIQDGDLEYDPADYLKLLEIMRRGEADIVMGARFTKGYHGLLVPRFGNRLLTMLLNLLFGARINDCMTCYKLLRTDTLRRLRLHARRFDLEIEIVCKALRLRLRIVEIPVSYQPRSYAQGKKIRWADGIFAIARLFAYRFAKVKLG